MTALRCLQVKGGHSPGLDPHPAAPDTPSWHSRRRAPGPDRRQCPTPGGSAPAPHLHRRQRGGLGGHPQARAASYPACRARSWLGTDARRQWLATPRPGPCRRLRPPWRAGRHTPSGVPYGSSGCTTRPVGWFCLPPAGRRTPALTCCRKPKRRRSVGCRQSGAVLG
jgi:hypothetical protein